MAAKKPRKPRTVPMPPPELQLLSVKQAGAILGIGHDLVYKLIMPPVPELYSFKLGGRRLIPRHAIDLLIAQKLDALKGQSA